MKFSNRIKIFLINIGVILFLTFFGCIPEETGEITNIEAKVEVDSLLFKDSSKFWKIKKNELIKVEESTQKFFYPNMSYCGGALYGIYKNKELIRIESTYSGELGYSTKNVDFEKNELVKIIYYEHFPEWDKYYEKYPDLDDIDPEKMTYSDTLYILEFGKKRSFEKYAGKKLISTENDEELVESLVTCIEIMKNELATEKRLVK